MSLTYQDDQEQASRALPCDYRPIVARKSTLLRTTPPVAYDCVKFIFIRHGSTILLSEFGERPATVGDVITLGANTLCGNEPEGSVTVTTLSLDRDYVIDQIFWQHVAFLTDRFEAQDYAAELYTEPAQILPLGEARLARVSPWIDELTSLSADGHSPEDFYRVQALLFAVLDIVAPLIRTTPTRRTQTQRRAARPGLPRHRCFEPVRAEAREAAQLLREAPSLRWTLKGLAQAVHLSPSQLSRVFVEAYGKTPRAYLTMLRAEHLARLLRETELSIEQASREVGWASRNHAARLFRECVGVTPSRYRLRQQAIA